MTDSQDLLRVVRETIYAKIAASGRLPSASNVASVRGLDPDEVESAFRALSDAHVVVLQPDTTELWSAPPFSAVVTSFRVRANGVSYYAPCAWDSFGIPAALKQDAVIDARCAWTGEPLPARVKNGRATGEGVIHLEVPARHFWDDIFYT